MAKLKRDGILIGVAMICGIGLSARPWVLRHSEIRSTQQQVKEAEKFEAQMVNDRNHEASLNTELGKEELLRSQGYRKNGELPFQP